MAFCVNIKGTGTQREVWKLQDEWQQIMSRFEMLKKCLQNYYDSIMISGGNTMIFCSGQCRDYLFTRLFLDFDTKVHLKISKYCLLHCPDPCILVYHYHSISWYWLKKRKNRRYKLKKENEEYKETSMELTDIAAMQMWKRPSSAVGSHGEITLKMSQTQYLS